MLPKKSPSLFALLNPPGNYGLKFGQNFTRFARHRKCQLFFSVFRDQFTKKIQEQENLGKVRNTRLSPFAPHRYIQSI